jgi:uncharacterized protein YjiK
MSKTETKFYLIFILFVTACNMQKTIYKSPQGYDFSKPEKFNMPEELHEISGIAFNKGIGDTIYTEQDEEGKTFHFKLGDKKTVISKFGSPGDFEDITVCNGYVYMLRSDGTLFSFPLSETNNANAAQVTEWKGLLSEGEFEGLASIDSSSEVFVLCKHCGDEKTSKKTGIYSFMMDTNGKIKSSESFQINVKEIESLLGYAKIHFHPSGFTFNVFTHEWYVLSSVNKLLVITDVQWKVKEVFPLNPALFQQPEGIAFDNRRNLYISNERNTRDYGTILKFSYLKN